MATRNPLKWPFASSSIWNQPIGSNAVYIDAQLPARTKTAVSAEQVALFMDIGPPSPTIQTLYHNVGQHGNRCTSDNNVALITLPLDDTFLVDGTKALNYPFGAISTDGTTRYEGGNYAHCTLGGPFTAGHADNQGAIAGDGLGGDSGGSLLSTIGGLIRYGEFTGGTDGTGFIKHALRFNLCGSTDLASTGKSPGEAAAAKGFRWPAQRADGYFNNSTDARHYAGSVPAAVEGSLFAIPISVDINAIGLTTTPGKMLAWTLQNYGGYVCNDSVVSTWAICVEYGPAGIVTDEFKNLFPWGFASTVSNPWGADCAIILSKLAVVDNNSLGSIGGGGTPLQPLAPLFSTGGGGGGGGTSAGGPGSWGAFSFACGAYAGVGGIGGSGAGSPPPPPPPPPTLVGVTSAWACSPFAYSTYGGGVVGTPLPATVPRWDNAHWS